jgi:hypothetical protein
MFPGTPRPEGPSGPERAMRESERTSSCGVLQHKPQLLVQPTGLLHHLNLLLL